MCSVNICLIKWMHRCVTPVFMEGFSDHSSQCQQGASYHLLVLPHHIELQLCACWVVYSPPPHTGPSLKSLAPITSQANPSPPGRLSLACGGGTAWQRLPQGWLSWRQKAQRQRLGHLELNPVIYQGLNGKYFISHTHYEIYHGPRGTMVIDLAFRIAVRDIF